MNFSGYDATNVNVTKLYLLKCGIQVILRQVSFKMGRSLCLLNNHDLVMIGKFIIMYTIILAFPISIVIIFNVIVFSQTPVLQELFASVQSPSSSSLVSA